ncbi:DUF2514 family protein [Acidovorax sp. SUPP1855]|uniref:DUF2514 family protein n=1 Tax=Acidovorax sp. SUPP1855 TaxID=431774 RepID=UPI0023DE5091|nr:DUF2514 family protein [Acidovorax sp. SUPP1855]GKS83210.1 DUF2514 family protein [Acidovorax sp. SUPP1855]
MILSNLKAYAWQLAALALAVALLAQTRARHVAELDAATTRTTLSAERERASSAALAQSEDHRRKEKELRNGHDRIEGATQAELLEARASAERAVAAGDRLQRDLAGYLTAHRQRALAAAAAGQCETDAGPVDLLAELRRRADQRAGALAAVADDARIRGAACEHAYDAAVATLNKPGPDAQAR